MTTDRLSIITNSHSWMTEDQARSLLIHKYLKFHKDYEQDQVDGLLTNYTTIVSQLPESMVRDQLARAQEFLVPTT